MTTLLRERPPTARQRPAPGPESPPLREVCLVGETRAVPSWGLGAKVQRGGKVYRVSAAVDPAPDDPRRYVYLSAVSDHDPTTD